uniref:Salivary secreted protein n=1 Tax=Haemonchus contortus TaxID=6289 RepID=A0A7I4YGT0_HAECO
MACATVPSLVLLLFAYVNAQWDPLGNKFNPIPPGTFRGNSIWPGTFRGGVFDPNWRNGNHNATVTTADGQTVILVTINGENYTATFPGTNLSISTVSGTYKNPNGQVVDVFTITVNNQTYVYTTINGKTTVTNGSGQVVSDGGPFHVTSR